MIDAYLEGGMVLVVAILFAGQIMFLQKTLMGKLLEIEEMTVALINRWNKSDDKYERRHEKAIGEMNRLTDDLAFLKGRINGGSR